LLREREGLDQVDTDYHRLAGTQTTIQRRGGTRPTLSDTLSRVPRSIRTAAQGRAISSILEFQGMEMTVPPLIRSLDGRRTKIHSRHQHQVHIPQKRFTLKESDEHQRIQWQEEQDIEKEILILHQTHIHFQLSWAQESQIKRLQQHTQ